MNIVIVHHHLNTGGVTKVIEVQIAALKQHGFKPQLIVGSNQDLKRDDLPIHLIPELDYLPTDCNKHELEDRLKKISQAFKNILSSTPDALFHFHNLCLGKNPLLNLAVDQLRRAGVKMINHCHDFAEDGRPHLLKLFDDTLSHYPCHREDLLYPKDLKQLRYAVINSMDGQRLSDKGVASKHTLLLPNAIASPPPCEDVTLTKASIRKQLNLDQRKLIVYPVRAIARKNIAEFVFLASLFKDQAHFLVTQAPKNPAEFSNYRTWVEFCKQHPELPVHFEVGQKVDFTKLMYAADAAISTSTQEGFGLGFLEPWLYDKPVFGRDLPEITKDFKAVGIRLPHLYTCLTVERVDFANLTLVQQKECITKSLQEPDLAAKYREDLALNDLTFSGDSELVASNKALILKHYSPTAYGKKLSHFYATSF